MGKYINFFGSIFDYDLINKKGDFAYMVKNETKRILYIYNENIFQWKKFNDLNKGGGNALLRPYRYDSPQNKGLWPRSIGIPTGPNFNVFSSDVKNIIDNAFQQVEEILLNDSYQEVWWSADNTGLLGVSIFQPCIDVIKYITMKIMKLAKKMNGELWMDYFHYYPKNKTTIYQVLENEYVNK